MSLLTVSRCRIGYGVERISAVMVGILLNSYVQRQNTNELQLPLQFVLSDRRREFQALRGHLKDHFQLDRRAKRKACDAIHKAAGILVFTEHVLEEFRSAISHLRLLADIS